MTTESLLAERGKTHGDFADHAAVTQALKHEIECAVIARTNRGQPLLTDGQREALDMIAHKIGRILAGDPDFADHWDDIAGYALLGRDSPKTLKRTHN